jgi:sugar O-acyltransferase (sialic acid O-acetyltransferase NeuD family)
MKYLIFGSGGFAKEVIDYIESDDHEIVGVISTQKFNSESYSKRYKIYSDVSELSYIADLQFILAVGDIKTKQIIVSKNENRWGTFIHSKSYVSKHAKIGKGSIICPFATVLGDSVIGKFTTLNVYACVAHDNVIGNYVTYSPYSGSMGNCTIGDECFFGTAAYAIPKIKLGNRIAVSAGSVVRHSYENEGVLLGNPAKPRSSL